MFIVLEGPDGSGKTTLAQAFTAHLNNKGINALYTFEPTTNEKYGQPIRKLLKKHLVCSPTDLSDLLTADRGEHLSKTILPALAEGKWVICDRYKYSALAYQQSQGIDAAYLIESNRKYLVPDITFILRPKNIDTLLQRINHRNMPAELFEKKAFLLQTLEFYDKMPDYFPTEIFCFLNAENSVPNLIAKMDTFICSKID